MSEEKENKEEENPALRKCSQCGRGQLYFRVKEGSFVCRRCGNVDLKEE